MTEVGQEWSILLYIFCACIAWRGHGVCMA